MSPFLLVTFVLVVLMAQRLADVYVGGHYVCPSCGTRKEDRHSRDCPWSDLPSE